MTPSLLCRTCGQPAEHVHFIPWTEQPDRAVLACAQHEPDGDDGEWFTLAEVEADPGRFLKTCARSAAPAPEALTAWLGSLTNDKATPEAAEPVARPPADGPLTVAQAADRENVSEKTIRRHLEALAESGGAWKVGAAWRIDPAALDRLRVEGQRPQRRGPRPSAADVGTKPQGKARVWGRP